MVNRESLLLVVPVGKENAASLSWITETLGLWSMKTIKHHLKTMVATRRICEVAGRAPNGAAITLYYRSSGDARLREG